MTIELVPDCRSDEIRSVRVEPLLHHQLDVTEVDVAKVERDFLGIRPFGAQFCYVSGHLKTIYFPSIGMVYSGMNFGFQD